MARILLFFAVSSLLCCFINCSCWFAGPPPLTENSELPMDCTFEGWTIANGHTYSFPAPLCQKCSCDQGMMSCCGYGRKGGKMHIEGCTQKIVEESCDVIFVDADDPNQRCPQFGQILSAVTSDL